MRLKGKEAGNRTARGGGLTPHPSKTTPGIMLKAKAPTLTTRLERPKNNFDRLKLVCF